MDFLVVVAVLCASLLGVALTAQQASAASDPVDHVEEDTIAGFFDTFFQSAIGGHVKNIMQLVGIVIILFTLFKNFGNAVKNGAGIMTVLPSILVGCLAGGVLMSPDRSAQFLGWIVEMMSDASGTIADTFGG